MTPRPCTWPDGGRGEEDWQRRDFERGIYEAADEQDRLEDERERAAKAAKVT